MTTVRLEPEIVRESFPTTFGEFRFLAFREPTVHRTVYTLVKGKPGPENTPLVRIHSQCLTGDVFHSMRCDCGQQFREALARIEASECGLLVYHMQEGRGIGLINKIKAYELQDGGLDTVEANLELGFAADPRTYGICAAVLHYFGIARVRLLSNNPHKVASLEAENIEVVERVSLQVESSPHAERYLRTKLEKMGHLMD